MKPHDVEILRRSVVMLTPGAWALRREQAEELLARLRELERLVETLKAQLAALQD